MHADGVVQEPSTRGMRMDRDYRVNHARSNIGQSHQVIEATLRRSRTSWSGPLSYSRELPLLPQGNTSMSVVKTGEHAAERLTRTRQFYTNPASEGVMIPFEYVRRDVRREGLLFQTARKRASEAKSCTPCPGTQRRCRRRSSGKKNVPELLWMPGVSRWLEDDCNGIASESPREGCVMLVHIQYGIIRSSTVTTRRSGMIQVMQWNLSASIIDGCMETYTLTTSLFQKSVPNSGEIDVRLIDCYYFGKELRKMYIGKSYPSE